MINYLFMIKYYSKFIVIDTEMVKNLNFQFPLFQCHIPIFLLKISKLHQIIFKSYQTISIFMNYNQLIEILQSVADLLPYSSSDVELFLWYDLASFPAKTILRYNHHCESPHVSRIWTCTEPEFRFCWVKLCSSDKRASTKSFCHA